MGEDVAHQVFNSVFVYCVFCLSIDALVADFQLKDTLPKLAYNTQI